MRVVIQRVSEANVRIGGKEVSHIGYGLLILLGIEDSDTQDDIAWLCAKIVNLRIFDDEQGVMNESILQKPDHDILLVSQFTLFASTKKGNRPSYIRASKPDFAVPMYEKFVAELSQQLGKEVKTGVFGAYMQVSLVNDGPVTICIDTKNKE